MDIEKQIQFCIKKQKLYTAIMAHFNTCYINRHKKICGCEILSQYLQLLMNQATYLNEPDLAQAYCNMNELLNMIQTPKGMVHFVKHNISECEDEQIINKLCCFFNCL